MIQTTIDEAIAREEAEARRGEGMGRVYAGARKTDPLWEEHATSQIREFGRAHELFTVEEFRAAYPPPEGVNPKAYGPLFKRAQKLGLVRAEGYVLVNCSNRSPRVQWRSLVFAGKA